MRCWRPERHASAWPVALTVLALATLLGGCGNERRDFREKQLNPLVRQASEERATLAAVLRASRPKRAQDETALRQQLSALAGVFRRIAALKPPDGVEGKFERYTRANARLLRALDRFVAAFAGGDRDAQRTAGHRAQEALGRATSAQRELQRALK